jgi:2-oxoglutarate ferredoxin oxidoreductase subunit delta
MSRNEGAKGGGIVCRGTVVIDVEACKGCDLCISACPPGVLSMTEHEVNTRGYRYPVLVAGCTGCKACSQICPDFVFQVYNAAPARRLGGYRRGDGRGRLPLLLRLSHHAFY